MSYGLDRTSSGSWTDTVSEVSTVDPPPEMHPSALLSVLVPRFIGTAYFATMTKYEIMDVIDSILVGCRDQTDALFEVLVSHEIITDTGNEKYLVSSKPIVGIFAPVSECYSPLCLSFRNPPCYSSTCPRRSQRMGILRLYDPDKKETVDWTDRALHGMASGDRKSAIRELLHSERDYVRDLGILLDHYGASLLQSNCIQRGRQKFHDAVFSNARDLINHHQRVAYDLVEPQNKKLLFDQLGLTLYKHFSLLEEDYVRYCLQHMKAGYMVEHERARNRAFNRFLAERDTAECVRKLEFRHFLTMPTQRIGKLKLLMTAIIKYTPKMDDDDYIYLLATIPILERIQSRMNTSVRKAEKQTELLRVTSSIIYPEHLPAKALFPDNANLVRSGELSLTRSSSHSIKSTPCQVFLFSHMLLVTRERITNGVKELEIIGDPISIYMLSVGDSMSFMRRFSSLVMASPSSKVVQSFLVDKDNEFEKSITGLYIRKRVFGHLRNSLRRHQFITSPDDPSEKSAEENVRLPTPPSETLQRPVSPAISLRLISPPPRPGRVISPTGFPLRRVQSPRIVASPRSSPIARRLPSASYCRNYNSRRKVLPYRAASPLQRSETTEKSEKPTSKTADTASSHRSPSRTLKLSNLGNTDSSFGLVFETNKERDEWIVDIRAAKQKFNDSGSFKSTPLCKLPVSASSSQIIASDGRFKFQTSNRILCSSAFAWYDNGQQKDMIALGTQNGIWISSRDGATDCRLVAPYHCQQLAVIETVMLVRTKKCLMTCDIDAFRHPPSPASSTASIATSCAADPWKVFKRKVLMFAVQPEHRQLCYVHQRRSGALSLVLTKFKPDFTYDRVSRFKRSKEYRLQLSSVSELQITHDSIFVRSEKEGVERISLLPDSSRIFSLSPRKIFGLNGVVGLVPPTSDASSPLVWLCSPEEALAVTWEEGDGKSFLVSRMIKFESRAKSIAVVDRFLITFSSSVIEIRDIETGKCIQSIAGHDIRSVYVSQPQRQDENDGQWKQPVVHFTTIKPDERVIQICELSLKNVYPM